MTSAKGARVSRRHMHICSFDCLPLLQAVIRNDVDLKMNTLSPYFAVCYGNLPNGSWPVLYR